MNHPITTKNRNKDQKKLKSKRTEIQELLVTKKGNFPTQNKSKQRRVSQIPQVN